MKNSIYSKIRSNSFYVVILSLAIFMVLVAVGIVFIRQIVITANDTLISAVIQATAEIMPEADEAELTSLLHSMSELMLDSIDRNIIMLTVTIVIFTVLVVFGTIFVSRRLAMHITVPIEELMADAKHIGEGNFDRTLEVKTGDELEVLADAFNTMISNITNMREKVRITNEEKSFIEKAHDDLRTILDTIPIGIRILSLDDWTLLYSNRACLDLFKCTSFEDQVKGQDSFGFMPEYQPDGRKTSDAIQILSKEEKSTGEIECLRLDGEPFLCRIASCTIEYEGHRASLAAMIDITAEQEYRKNLEAAAQKEKEANQLKSRFLATMSHEIRTPMNAIIGMSELALRSEAGEDKDEHIQSVKQSAAKLLTILNDILDFSKIEAGKFTISPETYSISSLISDIVSIIRMRVTDTELEFAVNADSNIPDLLLGDETRIRQCVINLLNNAVKYTDKGHVFLGIYGEFISDDMMNLIFEISDTGIGINEDDINKLFNDFTQLDFESFKINDGVGLGLAITRNIVNLMNGNVSVRSKPGKGSTFTITLPQKVCSHKPLAKIQSTEQKSVLVYTESEFFNDCLVWTVKNLGARCDCAEDNWQFIKHTQNEKYDYIFMSGKLYKDNGRTLSKLPKSTTVSVILDIGETDPDGPSNTLVMPVYSPHIASVFNNTCDSTADTDMQVQGKGADTYTMFTAPEANILIVDDIMTNLKVAEGLMSPYNMKIDLCSNGPDAIEAVKNRAGGSDKYDLIFMDHKMPGMDGVEVTQRIRKLDDGNPYFKELPIIALTANVVEGMKEMFFQNGLNDFLPKPIDINLLNTILEKWLPSDKQVRQS